MVVVVVIEAVREWRSEMIWRKRDLDPAVAEATAAEAAAAEIEAGEELTDARRSRPRCARRKEGTRGGGGGLREAEGRHARRRRVGGGGGGGGRRANAGSKKPKKGAAAVAAVADPFLRELVRKNLTSHEHSAALEAPFPEAASEVVADGGRGWRRRTAAAAAAAEGINKKYLLADNFVI